MTTAPDVRIWPRTISLGPLVLVVLPHPLPVIFQALSLVPVPAWRFNLISFVCSVRRHHHLHHPEPHHSLLLGLINHLQVSPTLATQGASVALSVLGSLLRREAPEGPSVHVAHQAQAPVHHPTIAGRRRGARPSRPRARAGPIVVALAVRLHRHRLGQSQSGQFSASAEQPSHLWLF